MITYEKVALHPSAFKSLTGMTVEAFDQLYTAVIPAHHQRLAGTLTKRDGQPRKRAVGCGRRYSHALRDRLVIALVWLRIYPPYDGLGFLFSLHKTNARLNVESLLDTLESMTTFSFERPSRDRSPLASLAAVRDAFPEVVVVVDPKEQRIRRPSGTDASGHSRQKPPNSGKKKAHTLKTQIAVRPDGRIEALSASVPGSTSDLTLLRKTRLLEQLAPDEGAMFDKG